MAENEQIISARQGDVSAWEALVGTHQQTVFRLAYLLLDDPDEAEDITQETFIRAYYALKRFDVERPIRPWLLKIAANLARNRRRFLGRYLAHLQRMARDEPQSTHSVQERDLQDRNDDSRLLWQAVRRLNSTDQEIIYLRYFLDMPEAEMAATLGVAAGAVKSRLHRALERLKKIIQQNFPDLCEDFEL